MKKLFVLAFSLVFILSLAGCANNTVAVPKAASAYVGQNYESVLSELQDAGFSNIETIEVNDLTSTSSLDDYAVGEISIDNNSAFDANTEFKKESAVVITYHTIPKLKIPISTSDLQEYDYETIATMFADAGFSNIDTSVVYDLDPDSTNVEFENEATINLNHDFVADSEIPFDSSIQIVCHRPFAKYDVTLHIDFVSNWLFNKYGVTVLLNGHEEDTLVHGEDGIFEFRLKEDTYTIRFENSSDSSIDGEIKLNVNSDTEASYKIMCWSDYISVDENYVDRAILGENEVKTLGTAGEFVYKNYQDVIKTLKEWGFVNIVEEPHYDISLGLTKTGSTNVVTINGSDSYRRGDVFDKNATVIVPYRMPVDDDPSLIKMAKNAISYEGQHYTAVEKALKDLGFSNIVIEKAETTDTSYDEGEVYLVTIDYESFKVGDTYKPTDKVLIKYYTIDTSAPATTDNASNSGNSGTSASNDKPVTEDVVLTVDNCAPLSNLIHLDWKKNLSTIKNFATSHYGDIIQLEMLTSYVEPNKNYKTRFNYTLYAVDGDNVMMSGPVFMFKDVNYSDLKLVGSNKPETFGVGIHCRVKAKVVGFENDMILLDPEAISVIKVY